MNIPRGKSLSFFNNMENAKTSIIKSFIKYFNLLFFIHTVLYEARNLIDILCHGISYMRKYMYISFLCIITKEAKVFLKL